MSTGPAPRPRRPAPARRRPTPAGQASPGAPASPPGPPAPPWRADRPQRRRLLTQEAIIVAALAIVDAEGCDAVSMRRVAGDLGVAASSLYQHVGTREKLLQAAVHHVMDDAAGDMPDTGDWRADLRDFFSGLRERLATHADLVRYAFADNTTPAAGDMRDAEDFLRRLTDVGLGLREAVLCFDRLMLYTIADVYEAWRTAQTAQDADRREWEESMREYMAQAPAESYPLIAAHHDLLMSAGDEREGFLFGLDLILDGMELRASRGATRSTSNITDKGERT